MCQFCKIYHPESLRVNQTHDVVFFLLCPFQFFNVEAKGKICLQVRRNSGNRSTVFYIQFNVIRCLGKTVYMSGILLISNVSTQERNVFKRKNCQASLFISQKLEVK